MRHRNAHRSGAKGPDELRQQIEQARHRLGDTVAHMTGRAEVKDRARVRAVDLMDKAGAMTVQLRAGAAQVGHSAQERMTKAGHLVQERAGHGTHTVRDRALRAGRTARHDLRAPRPVRSVMGTAARRPRPALILGAAGAAVVGAAVIWRRIDRRQ
ncbi:DUF3618 domain-containing protein [Streptomyces cinerochromogenes]|uniref:DUF3618 domain-containing protein n=1 Tax=Streptomyces cinerochromogenes TaxID=66422 RepID=A0ABW7BFW4_9ACTN